MKVCPGHQLGIAPNEKGPVHWTDPFTMTSIIPNSSLIHSRGGTRTPDPVINSHLLYHLSYSGSAQHFTRSARHGQAKGFECQPPAARQYALLRSGGGSGVNAARAARGAPATPAPENHPLPLASTSDDRTFARTRRALGSDLPLQIKVR